ncbi:MAG: pseudaminic acid synthase [Pseudomonadales bacterium]|nr:pseudaminic acid synthase [Pseudomonadales bacterium]
MMKYVEINNRRIGKEYPPYIIAELSANHNGDIERAFSIMECAKSAGADALKIQSYTPETITIDCDKSDFVIEDGLWKGRTLFDLYQWAHMPWEWHKPLFDRARALNLTLFSTPFDKTAVDLLEDLNAPAFKIASFEVIDLPLIAYVASTKKPMIISTGMADKSEIAEAVETARSAGCDDLIVLHCVSSYPALASDYNLKTVKDLAERYDVIAGLSDHTVSNVTAISSIAFGASVIEKHVTLSRSGGGPDDSFSIEPEEIKQLCIDTKIAWESIGKVSYARSSGEEESARFRRSLYAVKDITAGETLTEENIRSIRPGFGIAPKYYDEVIGKKATKAIAYGTALSFDSIG